MREEEREQARERDKHKVKSERRAESHVIFKHPVLRMKRSVVEMPQWVPAVPNQAVVADAGGDEQRHKEVTFTAK